MRGYDLHDLPEDMEDDPPEFGVLYHDHCRHVAFFRSWGFVDPEVIESHKQAIRALVKNLHASETTEEPGEDDLAELLSEHISFPASNHRELEALFRKALNGYDVRVVSDYFEYGGGPKGDEVEEYLYVLLRKARKTTAPAG